MEDGEQTAARERVCVCVRGCARAGREVCLRTCTWEGEAASTVALPLQFLPVPYSRGPGGT